MKKYTIQKLVDVALSNKRLKAMTNFAIAQKGKDIRVLTDSYEKCYSCNDYWIGLCLTLGKAFYSSTFNDTDDVDVTELKEKYYKIASVYLGAYYHEFFHLMYTPFQHAATLSMRCHPDFRVFCHQVSNILEDVSIEAEGCAEYPFAKPYIDTLTSCFQQESQIQLVTDAINTQPEDAGTLIAYLLHYCRGTDMSQFPTYKLWEDNKEFIEYGVGACKMCPDPYARVQKQIAFAMQLLKILNLKKPDKNEVDNPDMNSIAEQSSSMSVPGGSSGSKGRQATAPLNQLTDTSTSGPKSASPEQLANVDTPEKVDEESLTERKAERGSGESSSAPLEADLTKEGITMLANDDPVSNYSHMTDKLNKYVKTSQYLPEYNKVVKMHDVQIRNVVAIIRKMLGLNNGEWRHYRLDGKLDMRTIYKKDNYKIFKKAVAPKEAADLVFEILVDNSGSMHGSKAKLAGEALIIFCEALNRLHIPFSVDAFTEARAAITISLKEYHESYDKVKTNMTLFTQLFNVDKLATWNGNIDEINLSYVADELALRPEKDKVLIVISDGATCGSRHSLKQIAKRIQNSGIAVLGIGIFDHNVETIYDNHIVLTTREDLEQLGGFLNRYLIGKIFK